MSHFTHKLINFNFCNWELEDFEKLGDRIRAMNAHLIEH